MNNDDIYCTYCGIKLETKTVPNGYDAKTGEKKFYSYKTCTKRLLGIFTCGFLNSGEAWYGEN